MKIIIHLYTGLPLALAKFANCEYFMLFATKISVQRMFLRIYIPVVFDNSDKRCYKLLGLTDQSTDAMVPFKPKQWQLLTEGRLCLLLFAEI